MVCTICLGDFADGELQEFLKAEKLKKAKKQINHITQNIQLSSKITKIREIQLFYRNHIAENNLEQIKEFQDFVDFTQRHSTIQQMNKWNNFRDRR